MGGRDAGLNHREFTTTYENTVTADQHGHYDSNINPADNLAHQRKCNVGKFQLSNGDYRNAQTQELTAAGS